MFDTVQIEFYTFTVGNMSLAVKIFENLATMDSVHGY